MAKSFLSFCACSDNTFLKQTPFLYHITEKAKSKSAGIKNRKRDLQNDGREGIHPFRGKYINDNLQEKKKNIEKNYCIFIVYVL